MSAASRALEALRRDPTNACIGARFKTGPKPGSWDVSAPEGGACRISAKKLDTDIYELQAESGAGTDYFYPWLRCGVGWVRVPDTVPDGTMVVTGGVNGCSITASHHGGYYYFYHDGDSKYLDDGMVQGGKLAHVAPKDYDPLGMGNTTFSLALQEASRKGVKPKGDTSYGHFVMAVKTKGRFGFYASGIMSLNGLRKLPFGITPCIVTFSHDD